MAIRVVRYLRTQTVLQTTGYVADKIIEPKKDKNKLVRFINETRLNFKFDSEDLSMTEAILVKCQIRPSSLAAYLQEVVVEDKILKNIRNVRRRPNSRYNDKYVTQSQKFSKSIMVWGAIKFDGSRMNLSEFLSANRYIELETEPIKLLEDGWSRK
ncbi:hypothetical protein A3Q56_00794 [Intoshia linei]|uniref:Uncharacterized protein n=1 Tax=Intoshia linei TaxID=1819745 RepID=A0A177BAU8_9BILA|nr:hypothetical protein A3Q56_00794 [Intoshia linei]